MKASVNYTQQTRERKRPVWPEADPVGDGCPGMPHGNGQGNACEPDPADADDDSDGVCNGADGCPLDPERTLPGICGCGVSGADSDSDCDADLADFAAFQNCFSTSPISGLCQVFDFNADQSIDLSDFAEVQRLLGGR